MFLVERSPNHLFCACCPGEEYACLHVSLHCRYESHYGLPLGRKKTKKDAEPAEDDVLAKKKSNHLVRKLEERRKDNKAKVDLHLEEQFLTGRLYGKVSIRSISAGT